MQRCSRCHAELPEAGRFCPSCGEPATGSAPLSRIPTELGPSAGPSSPHRTPSSVGRLISSGSIDAGAFTPGTVIAERYRIIGVLGRGGMGEVYRADDLKLGQTVALKFLPKALSKDEALLTRFHTEVRLARQVSHPNVCRVYDIDDVDRHHFLSMEYVDGEDLASLLKRIGHLPADKALEIARQLCAGLAAAHEKGVLHRDLKPANVMLDGRGRVRITDFGLAVAGDEAAGEPEISGTPAYMAPEQLAGKGASVRSDLYSLGLVLYEVYTGKRAFEAPTLAEFRRKHAEEPPAPPSQVSTGIDPAVERVILRCLEKEPGMRPASAMQVASALPGGDPLAAALAAGETPSPEMVAAAGETGAMRPAVALVYLAAILVGLALAAYLSPRAYLHGSVPLEKPPEALVERSKEIVRRLGYPEKPVGTAWGLSRDSDYLRWVEEHDKSKGRWKDMADGRPAAIYFWFRQGSAPLIPERFRGADSGGISVRETDPPTTTAGMVGVRLDPLGRLIRFEAVPPSAATAGSVPPDWSALFAEAALDAAAFSQTEPHWIPPSYADVRMAWVERVPERPDHPLRLEAAALRGRPVFFELAGPWSRPPRAGPVGPKGRRGLIGLIGIGTFLVLLAGGALIARRNLRLGRSDRRGANRVATFLFACFMLSWALEARHVASVSELFLFILGVSFALFFAGLGWMLYVALEPLIRRRWPDSLIAWTRLLSGRLADPLVGRVLLAGAVLGTFEAVSTEVEELVRRAVEATPPVPPFPWLETLLGPRSVAQALFGAPAVSMLLAIGFTLLFFLFRAVLRKDWLAAGVFVLFWTVPSFLAGSWISVAFGLVLTAAHIFVFLRFGLLALVFDGFFNHFLQFPLTTDSSAWYAGTSLFLLVVLAGLAVYGFRTAVGGQPLFSGARLDD